MEDRNRRSRVARWGLAAALLLAALASSLVTLRLIGARAPIRDAERIIVGNDPAFVPTEHRVEEVTRSADGRHWKVRFARVAGRGQGQRVAIVPVERSWLSEPVESLSRLAGLSR